MRTYKQIGKGYVILLEEGRERYMETAERTYVKHTREHGQLIPKSKWIQHVVEQFIPGYGIETLDFPQILKILDLRGEAGELILVGNNRRLRCGKLSIETVGSLILDAVAAGIDERASRWKPKFVVVMRWANKPSDSVDVMVCQGRPEYNGATFQVASNAHCIETTSPEQAPNEELLPVIMDTDPTQGAFAGIGCPSTLFAKLAPFADPRKPKNEWLQTKERHINVLENLCKWLSDGNGYPIVNSADAAASISERQAFDVSVGLLRDVPPIYTGVVNGDMLRVNLNTRQRVNHVYCTALNRDQNFGRVNTERDPEERITATLLRGAYLGTLLCAEKCKSEKCVLTMLGGGSFCNDWDTIADAIVHAMQMMGHIMPRQGSVKEIRLCIFDLLQTAKNGVERLRTLERLVRKLKDCGFDAEMQ